MGGSSGFKKACTNAVVMPRGPQNWCGTEEAGQAPHVREAPSRAESTPHIQTFPTVVPSGVKCPRSSSAVTDDGRLSSATSKCLIRHMPLFLIARSLPSGFPPSTHC